MGQLHIKGKHGASRNYTPEELVKAVDAYFKYIEKTPVLVETLQKVRVSKDLDEIKAVPRRHRKPATVTGLALFMGITRNALHSYSIAAEYKEAYEYARMRIENQLFEGGVTGQFEPNLIARTLGLAEKTETRLESIQTIDTVEIVFAKRDKEAQP